MVGIIYSLLGFSDWLVDFYSFKLHFLFNRVVCALSRLAYVKISTKAFNFLLDFDWIVGVSLNILDWIHWIFGLLFTYLILSLVAISKLKLSYLLCIFLWKLFVKRLFSMWLFNDWLKEIFMCFSYNFSLWKINLYFKFLCENWKMVTLIDLSDFGNLLEAFFDCIEFLRGLYDVILIITWSFCAMIRGFPPYY